MGIFSRMATAGVLAVGLGLPAMAQVTTAPLSEAQARLACGNGVVLSAVTLPNGSIEVTCEAQAAGQVPAALAGALTPQAAAAIVATVVVIAIIVGDDDSSSTTTVNTSPSAGAR